MATHGDVVFVRVAGVGNLENSIPLRRFLDSARERGYRKFVFELGACEGFDSTFMGTILGVALARSTVVLVNVGTRERRLLEDVGIHRIVEVCEGSVPFPEVAMEELQPGAADRSARFEHILTAHEDLVRHDPGKNAAKFGEFLELLRRELGEERV